MGCFTLKDPSIYDELEDVEPATAVVAGDAAVVRDVLGFYLKSREETGEEVAFVYRARQVEAAKRTGTGEAIKAGDKLYLDVSEKDVSATKTGADYFCGWAKRDAAANDTVVLMNFDGTRYSESI
jgi:predicted RecA/RadA family phage recombinase